MSNRVYFTFTALLALGLIALALVYPQGLGARSPKPFGHPLAPVAAPKVEPPHRLKDVL